jgi:hypothetical protein
MAETPKPAAKKAATSTRKKTTKRGPTKATALKALGLTKEDLDLLAQVKQAREAAAKHRAESESPYEADSHADAAKAALAETEKVEQTETEVPQAGPFYARNARTVEVGIRLARQDKGKKRFDLKPRGQRGDLVKLQPEDLEDDAIITNVNYGVIEIITAVEAKAALEKQSINAQQAIHPAMALLRNELGEPYAPENIRTEAEFNSQGVTVAHLKPVGGEFGEIEFDRANRGSFNRNQPVNNPGPGGNPAIISDGFARNDSAAQADAVARRKDLQGPEAGLGGVSVVVEPTRRT